MSGTIRIGEAATLLGITEDHLRDLTDSGRVPHARTPGGHRFFETAILEEIRAFGIDRWWEQHRKIVASVPDASGAFPEFQTWEILTYEGIRKERDESFLAHRSFDITILDWGMQIAAYLQDVRSSTNLRRGINVDPSKLAISNERRVVGVDSTTWGFIETCSVVIDPLVLDPEMPPDVKRYALDSYTTCVNALISGVLSIDMGRRPLVVPISRLQVLQPKIEGNELVVSPGYDLNAGSPLPEEMRVVMPPGTSAEVKLYVPSRPTTMEKMNRVALWSGILSLGVRNVPTPPSRV